MTEPGGYEPSTYGESFADVYDDWYADVSDASATVRVVRELAGSGSILELGVGTGRLAIPLAESGSPVVGVDASQAMLEILAAKAGEAAIVTVEADMAALDRSSAVTAHAPFALAFAAFNTFFNLPSDAAQDACLAGCADVLADGGRLVIEGFVPPSAGLSDGGVSVREVTSDAAVLTVSTHDDAAQLIRGHHIEMRADGNTMRPWLIHYRTPAQLDASTAAAGFVLEQRWADWHRTPFDPARHDIHVSVYRKDSA